MHRLRSYALRRISGVAPAIDHKVAFIDPDLALAKPFEEIPGVKTFWASLKAALDFMPIVGKYHYKPFRLHELHMEAYKTYGKIYRFNALGGFRIVFVYDPDDIKKVFKLEGKYPKRLMLGAFKHHRDHKPEEYTTAGILMENGIRWRDTRFKVQKTMLQPAAVASYIPCMEKVSSDFIHRMKYLRDEKGEIPDYLQELYKWALESVCVFTFNVRLGCLAADLTPDSEPARMISAVSEAFEIATDTEFGPRLWRLCPMMSKSYRKIDECQSYVRSVTKKYIELARDEMKKTGNEVEIDGGKGIIQPVLQLNLDPKEIATFIMDLLTAGIDTTSHSFACLLYLLARNPDKQEKLFKEIRDSHIDSALTAEALDALPYLRACIKESMRVMSVVDGTQRFFKHDIALGGYRIPAGTMVLVLTQITAKLPQYFEEPEKFKPERWLPGEKKYHTYANLPFGFGPRGCIGRKMATQEMQLLLIKIMQNFKVEYHYEDINLKTRFVMMPDKPLKFAFIDRKQLD